MPEELPRRGLLLSKGVEEAEKPDGGGVDVDVEDAGKASLSGWFMVCSGVNTYSERPSEAMSEERESKLVLAMTT